MRRLLLRRVLPHAGPVGIAMSVVLTILAIIGIWEKDQPKYFGIGGEKPQKVKVSEYIQIIKENKPMQR